MSDIMAEYTKRHNLPLSIHPITEGLVFFKNNNNETLCALVSSVSKSFKFCKECYENNNSGTIFEVVSLDSFEDSLNCQMHKHYSNEFDVITEFKKHFYNDCTPVPINSTRKLEEFIWNLYIDIFHKTHPSIMRQRKNWIDEMIFMSMKHSSVFERYYLNLYSPLVINRKYLHK